MGKELENLSQELHSLKNEMHSLVQKLGYVEKHHGDALTEFGKRLGHIENTHGTALVKLGSRLEVAIAATKQVPQQQSTIQTEQVSLPENTFISEFPVRYNEQLALYRAQGGHYTSDGNSIRDNWGDMARFFAFSNIFDLLEKDKLAGDLAELGVFKGDTAVMLANAARRMARTAFLLDTYEGFDGKDLEASEKHLIGAFSETSLDYVKSRVGEEGVVFIKGFFPDSAVQLPQDNQYSLVHIDADLYAPIKAGLEYFYPRLVEGGFLIMHDYMSLCWEGAIRAIDEFFMDKPEFIIPIPDRSGTVVIRKMRR